MERLLHGFIFPLLVCRFVSHLFGEDIISHHHLIFNSDPGVSWHHRIQPVDRKTQWITGKIITSLLDYYKSFGSPVQTSSQSCSPTHFSESPSEQFPTQNLIQTVSVPWTCNLIKTHSERKAVTYKMAPGHCYNMRWRNPSNRSVSLMTAFRYGIWVMSSLFGNLSPGQTWVTSRYNCSCTFGFFASWYRDHEIVLEVWNRDEDRLLIFLSQRSWRSLGCMTSRLEGILTWLVKVMWLLLYTYSVNSCQQEFSNAAQYLGDCHLITEQEVRQVRSLHVLVQVHLVLELLYFSLHQVFSCDTWDTSKFQFLIFKSALWICFLQKSEDQSCMFEFKV